MAFTRREDLTDEKVELICAMSHQIALAVQLDRLACEARDVALLAERNRIARDGLEEARRSVHALRPMAQDDSLFERLRTILAALTAGASLRVDASQTGVPAALSEQADWAAVKFVQQALANTLRYPPGQPPPAAPGKDHPIRKDRFRPLRKADTARWAVAFLR